MSQHQKGNRSTTLAPPVLLCAVLALPWVLAAAPAQAASRQTPEKTARKACLSGDYEKGVAILSDLFVETQDPTWIFNQARCFEQNRRYEDAIARFQEYLRAAPDLASRAGLPSADWQWRQHPIRHRRRQVVHRLARPQRCWGFWN